MLFPFLSVLVCSCSIFRFIQSLFFEFEFEGHVSRHGGWWGCGWPFYTPDPVKLGNKIYLVSFHVFRIVELFFMDAFNTDITFTVDAFSAFLVLDNEMFL